MAAASAGISAIGSVTNGIAQGNAAAYRAKMDQNNAQISSENARYVAAAGQEQADRQGQANAQRLGLVRASMAANGVDVNSGSSASVQEGEREAGLLSQQTILSNAQRNEFGYEVQGQSDAASAALEQQTADQAPIAGALGAAGSLLGSSAVQGMFSSSPGTAPGASASGSASSDLSFGSALDDTPEFQDTTPNLLAGNSLSDRFSWMQLGG